MTNGWFEVNKAGLRRNRGDNPASIILEMLQNAKDTDALTITVTLTPTGQRGRQLLVVEDDDPQGYADLSHAWMLFAPSTKATDVSKAGFQNFGEKLVLAWAESGTVASTTGTVEFLADGTRKLWTRRKRAVGSRHEFVLEITQVHADAMIALAQRVIIEPGRTLTVNGVAVTPKAELNRTKTPLTVYVSDDPIDPVMKRKRLVTDITLHAPETDGAWLYNIGLPVQPLDTPWSVNVHNRLQQDSKRDQIPEKVLNDIIAAVTTLMREEVTEADVDTWARDVINTPNLPVATARKLLEVRHGPDALVGGADHEANARAASNGRPVIGGRALTPEARDNLHRVQEAAPEAFQTTNAVFGDKYTSVPTQFIAEVDWTPEMQRVVGFAKRMHQHLFGRSVSVSITSNTNITVLAQCGNSKPGGWSSLMLHAGVLDASFWTDEARVLALLLHEFGHVDHVGASHSEVWANHALDLAGRVVVWGGRL